MKNVRLPFKWVFITPGDPEGVGPEVAVGALHSKPIRALLKRNDLGFVLVGSKPALMGVSKFDLPVPVFSAPTGGPGFQSAWSVRVAAEAVEALAKQGTHSALVTGPLSKERVQKSGFKNFTGHTGFIESIWGGSSTMMLANTDFRVSLATTHLPLSRVAKGLTKAAVSTTIENTLSFLKKDLGIKRPRVAVLGLNPHAGEAGILGKEELTVLRPVIRAFSRRGVLGPFPADTFFATEIARPRTARFDAVVAMYHDQGLTPVKLIDFKNTVNITLGLPYIRTSVDHGTAFDIANKGLADPSSMIAAILMAVQLLDRRAHATRN